MEKPLPFRILSTRALGNSAREFTHHENWLIDIVSMIETHGVINSEQIKTLLHDLNETGENSVLLFSSENGVKWLKWGADKFGFKIPAGLKAACVGVKTSNTAVEWLNVEPFLFEKNSEALLGKMKNTFTIGTSFHFFCGNKRLDTLPVGLREFGFEVKEHIVYQTELTPHKTIRDYKAVLFFSPSAVESYFKVNFWDRKMVAVSIGSTTAEALNNAGVEIILLADETNELAMLAKLKNYLKD